MPVVDVQDLTKRYGEVTGVESLSFDVAAGEIFGFLGPNGAGKTTTIRTLMGGLSPTEGTATVLGADVREEAELVESKGRPAAGRAVAVPAVGPRRVRGEGYIRSARNRSGRTARNFETSHQRRVT